MARLFRPWTGSAFRHIPAGLGAQPLDRRYAGRASTNRWNEAGQPTIYLAGDQGVMIAEWGRHFRTVLTADLLPEAAEREVYRIDLLLGVTLDLRDPNVCEALSLAHAPLTFSDIAVARATAAFIRRTTDVQGIFVPSMAFPDDPARWCLVLFLENLPDDDREFVQAVVPAGILRRG